MNSRIRRLQSDYVAMRRLARLHPRIDVEGVVGNPPERYRLALTVRSLRENANEEVGYIDRHRIEVVLPRHYPRDAPICRMLTPVFHPNIAPHAICVGDHWTAAESLDDMIQRIGEMLSFQSYNVQSPLNGRAAQWVESHLRHIPTDKSEFYVDLRSEDAAPTPTSNACANCAATEQMFELCPEFHALCSDCVDHCPECDGTICLVCGDERCRRCAGPTCANCGDANATARACPASHELCDDCVGPCGTCGQAVCLVCGVCTACGVAIS